jgi:ABC-type multidrug transport system ATPase subunit
MSADDSDLPIPHYVHKIFLQRLAFHKVPVVAPTSKMKAVVLESVSKTFREGGFFSGVVKDETRALQKASLEAATGEVVGLLGPNGSGKSTTLKLVSTVLLPDDGRVLVEGFDTRCDGPAVRKRVGFALASERSFFPRLTARENLEFFAALEDVPRRECRDRVESVLNGVGLCDAAEKHVMKLSSGMHQRLGIARALLKNPSILLLDEPSRSLDLAAASHLWGLVRELANKGMSILMATHNFAEAAEVCERVAILQQGSLISTLSTRTLSERQLRESYLHLAGQRQSITWSEEVPA